MKAHPRLSDDLCCLSSCRRELFSASSKPASSNPLTAWNKCCGLAVITGSHQLLIGWYGETEGT